MDGQDTQDGLLSSVTQQVPVFFAYGENGAVVLVYPGAFTTSGRVLDAINQACAGLQEEEELAHIHALHRHHRELVEGAW